MNKLHECIGCHKYLPNTYKLYNGEFICNECLDKIGIVQREIANTIVDYLKNASITNPENQIFILGDVINTIKYDNGILEKSKIKKMKKIAKKMEKMEKQFNEK